MNNDGVNWSCSVLGVDPCQFGAGIVNGFLQFLHTLIAPVVNIPPEFTYQLNGVQAMWGWFRAISILLLALFTMIGGVQMMIGRAIGSQYTPPREFIPKVVAAFLACNASFLICQSLIGLGNTIDNATFAFTGNFVNTQGNFIASFLLLLTGLIAGTAINGFFILLDLLLIIFLLILIFRGWVRIFLVALLIVTSPLAIAAWVLPQTQKWTMFWFSLFITTIVEVFLEDVVLCLVVLILFSTDVHLLADTPVRLLIALTGLFMVTRVRSILTRMGGAGERKGLLNSPFALLAGLRGFASTALPGAGTLAGALGGLGFMGGKGGDLISRSIGGGGGSRADGAGTPGQGGNGLTSSQVTISPVKIGAGNIPSGNGSVPVRAATQGQNGSNRSTLATIQGAAPGPNGGGTRKPGNIESG